MLFVAAQFLRRGLRAGGPKAALERALDRSVEGVQPVERERLGGREPAAGAARAGRPGVRAVVGEDAVEQRQPAVLGQRARGGADDLRPDREVAEHPALVGEPELGAVGELARAAAVVQDRRRHQQVRVEPRVQRAGLADERRDRDRVLEQPAEVRVVARARARRAAELGRQRAR